MPAIKLPEKCRIVEKDGKRFVVIRHGDKKHFDKHYQCLYRIKKSWFFGDKLVEVDREEIPTHAMISLACYGDTGGWKSKFNDFI